MNSLLDDKDNEDKKLKSNNNNVCAVSITSIPPAIIINILNKFIEDDEISLRNIFYKCKFIKNFNDVQLNNVCRRLLSVHQLNSVVCNAVRR